MAEPADDQAAPSAEGYLRVAVAQVATHPAALLDGPDLLEHPAGRKERLFPTAFTARYRAEARQMRARVKSAYIAQLQARLEAIVATCRRWSVQVLAFPEYSIPIELIEGLLPASQSMVIVAGSHGVRPDREELYARLGGVPEPGLHVAPVLYGGRVAGWIPKEQPALAEVGRIEPGLNGGPVELPGFVIPKVWVRICLDYLAAPATDDDVALSVVIARTPGSTAFKDFASLASREAERLHRPVLLASDPSGGGSKIFVATKDEGLPALAPDVEGLLVADILIAPRRAGETGAYHKAQLVVPVAEASLVYTATGAGQAYAAALEQKPTSLGEPIRAWATKTLELSHTKHPSVQRRLGELADETFVRLEHIAARTRELVMAPTILPIDALQGALAKGVENFIRDRRSGLQAQLVALESELESVVARGLKADLIPAAQALAERIAETIAREAVVPAESVPVDDETARAMLERALDAPRSEARAILSQVDPAKLAPTDQLLWALTSINCGSDDPRVPRIAEAWPREQRDVVEVFKLLSDGGPVPDTLPADPHVRVLAAMRLVQSGDQERAVELAEALLRAPNLSPHHKVDAFLAATLALHATVYEYPSTTRPVPVAVRTRLIAALDAARVELDTVTDVHRRFYGPRSLYVQLVEDREARKLEFEGEPEKAFEGDNELASEWAQELLRLGELPTTTKLAELVEAYPGREPLESELAEALLTSGRVDDAVPHAKRAFEVLPGIGKALRLARTLARRRPTEALRVLQGFEDRESELIALFCADLEEALGRPTDAMKRLETFLARHPDSVRARVWIGRLRYNLEGGSKGPNDAWDAVRSQLGTLRAEVLRRVAEVQGPPLSESLRAERLKAIATALRAQHGVEAELTRVSIQSALHSMGRHLAIDPRLLEVNPRPLIEAGMLIEMTRPMLEDEFERRQQLDHSMSAGYQQGFIGFEAWIAATGREPETLAGELLTSHRWRWPLFGHVGENASAALVLLGLAELVVLGHLKLLDLVTHSNTSLVVFHDVFNRLTRGAAPKRTDLGAWLIDLQQQGRLDVRPRPTFPQLSQATGPEREVGTLLGTPLSYFEELHAADKAQCPLIFVTADFGTGNLFAVPSSAAADLKRQWPEVDWTPYLRLRPKRVWPLAQWLETLGADLTTLRELVALGSLNAVTTQLLMAAGSRRDVRALLEPLFKRLGGIPSLASDHLALAAGVWLHGALDTLILNSELAESRDELFMGVMASLRVLKGGQATFGYWFGMRVTEKLGMAGNAEGLSELAEAIGRELAGTQHERERFCNALVDGLTDWLQETRSKLGLNGPRLASIVVANMLGPTESAIDVLFVEHGFMEASVLASLAHEPCDFVVSPPMERVLREATELIVADTHSHERLSHEGVREVVDVDGQRVAIVIPSETLILRCEPKAAPRFALRFADHVGRHDEEAARLARKLAEDPNNETARWAFAMRALRAPWRRVRRWPAYALEWLSKADSGRIALSREELLMMLGETGAITHSLESEVAARFAKDGTYANRGDAMQVLADIGSLPLSRHVGQLVDFIRTQVPTDRIATDAISDLLIHRRVRSSQLVRVLLLLGSIAEDQASVSLNGEAFPLRQTMLAKLAEMLSDASSPGTIDFAEVEPALGLVSSWIVAVVDKQDTGGPTLDLTSGRWLTLRLFDWLCRQVVYVPHQERWAALGPILTKARELSKFSPIPDDALDARAWGPLGEDQRLNLRLANLLFAMQMQMTSEHRASVSEHMMWSPAIEECLLGLASRPLTPVERGIRHCSSRKGSVSRELAVSPMVTVPDLAMTNLMMMRPEAFARLSPDIRLRWIEDLPRGPDDDKHAPYMMLYVLLNGLVHATAQLGPSELESFRKLVDGWLEEGVTEWWLLPAMLAVGVTPTAAGDAKRLLALLARPEASSFVSDYVAALAGGGADELENELRALMAHGNADTPYQVLRALTPLLLRSEDPNHAAAEVVVRRLLRDPQLASDTRVRLLLTNLGWKP